MFNGWNIHGFVVDFAKPDNVLVMSLLGAFVPAYVIRRNKKDTIDTTTEVVDSKEEKNV